MQAPPVPYPPPIVHPVDVPPPASAKVPLGVMIIFGLDVFLSLFRGVVGGLGVVGYIGLLALKNNGTLDPAMSGLLQTTPFVILSDFGMCFLGPLTAALVFFKKPLGGYLALLDFAFGMLGVLLAGWQAYSNPKQTDEAARVGYVIGATLALGVRLFCNLMYMGAAVYYLRWCNRQK